VGTAEKTFSTCKIFSLVSYGAAQLSDISRFFTADKELFFQNYGFIMEQNLSCNYSMVLTMKKDKRSTSGT